ncbi:MAG: ABC transporter substrate-binding protein [Deltaproteobacteria bacterium]|nr:ABC transporter substrate-binding protein [Deltaproteobacteria bacterium]
MWGDVERTSRTNWIVGVGSAISLILLIGLMSWLRPGVPKEVTILAGLEGGRSHQWATRYAAYVESHGVRANVVSTAGSGEILDRFEETTKPTVGFLQSGVEREARDAKASEDLQSLGSLFFEPMFLFVHQGSDIHDVPDLDGKRFYSGQPGSDTRSAVRALLETFDIQGQALDPELDRLTPAQATDALLAGQIDAAFLAGESGEGQVRRLLAEDGVRPISAQHAEVFTRLHPDTANLLIPQGLFDLGEMIPREDLRVIAPAMNLVTHQNLHPALIDLFLDAATSIHRPRTLLSKRGQFPSEDYTSLPMNPEALRYYKDGPRGLRKYLPFWLASLVDQLIIYVLPVFVVLSTVFKGIPVVLEVKTKLELGRIYKRIQRVENATDHETKRDEYLAELDRLEAASAKLRTPMVHLPQYFELRQYIHDMRDRLERGW